MNFGLWSRIMLGIEILLINVDSERKANINRFRSLNNGTLQCNTRSKIIKYIIDCKFKEKEIAKILEKLGQDEKVLNVKLKKIHNISSELTIQFHTFDQINNLNISIDQEIRDKVLGIVEKNNFSREHRKKLIMDFSLFQSLLLSHRETFRS